MRKLINFGLLLAMVAASSLSASAAVKPPWSTETAADDNQYSWSVSNYYNNRPNLFWRCFDFSWTYSRYGCVPTSYPLWNIQDNEAQVVLTYQQYGTGNNGIIYQIYQRQNGRDVIFGQHYAYENSPTAINRVVIKLSPGIKAANTVELKIKTIYNSAFQTIGEVTRY